MPAKSLVLLFSWFFPGGHNGFLNDKYVPHGVVIFKDLFTRLVLMSL